jgi:hypothetical protein
MKPYYEDTQRGIVIYHGDCREVLPALPDSIVVSDPPYGIDFKYGGAYKDVGGAAYSDLLRVLLGRKNVLLQYPEEMMRYMVPLFGAPDDCLAWCYNSNTARQFRLWGFWGVAPDFSRVRVPAKNPTDSRVSALVSSYDWTTNFRSIPARYLRR